MSWPPRWLRLRWAAHCPTSCPGAMSRAPAPGCPPEAGRCASGQSKRRNRSRAGWGFNRACLASEASQRFVKHLSVCRAQPAMHGALDFDFSREANVTTCSTERDTAGCTVGCHSPGVEQAWLAGLSHHRLLPPCPMATHNSRCQLPEFRLQRAVAASCPAADHQ